MTLAPAPNQGNLAESSFCEILAELSRCRETGVLRLSGPSPAKSVYLQEGRIVFASSTDPDDRLGELLLTRGIISRQQLDDASRDLSPGKRLGTALVEKGFLPASDLPKWVREQVKEILFSLFSWTEGTFHFDAGPFPSREAVTLRLSTPEIFLSGLRQVQKWSVLRKGAGEIRIPYRLAPEYGQVLKDAALGEEEEKLLTLLKSKLVTMEQAAVESSLSTLKVYQLFFAFRVLGVIHPVAAPAPSPPLVEAPITTAKAPEAADPQPAVAAEQGSQTVIVRVSEIPAAGIPVSAPPGEPEEPIARVAEAGRVESVSPVAAIDAEATLSERAAAAEPVPSRPVPKRRTPAAAPEAPLAAAAAAKAAPVAKPPGAPAQTAGATEAVTAVPAVPEGPGLAPPAVKRGKPEFRVIKVEARRLDSDGPHHLEELLRQWTQKGFHLAGVVPGTTSGLFGSAGPSFLIFTRDGQT